MQRIDTDSLVLQDDNDERIARVSDLLVGDLQHSSDGKYRDLTLTVPISPGVQLGRTLNVFNTESWQTVFTFVSDRIHFQIQGECFQRIDARAYVEA
ncbi:MAG: hypothetical protein AB8G99_14745 [Planctomycetaceae bacterium]